MEEAFLLGAHLEKANLHDANLERARLEYAHLEGLDLRSTRLTGAFADTNTTWPTGFDWKAAGVRLVS
jgi:uncharacterized protein YjbI with pentapeptide repeats